VQEKIQVRSISDFVPAMINREIKSGYWDFPIKNIPTETECLFICFFDFDQLDYRDNRYVRVEIKKCKSHPEVIGKHALIETQYVSYSLG